ncbi:hypothetical protein V8D89_002304 [Ganoderma adspersum]
MGQVKPLDVAVMGSMIHSLAAGARDGLQAAGQLRLGNPPEEDIIDAFMHVYGYLDEQLTLEEQELIGFDTIMVEHLLCKYQRLPFYMMGGQPERRHDHYHALPTAFSTTVPVSAPPCNNLACVNHGRDHALSTSLLRVLQHDPRALQHDPHILQHDPPSISTASLAPAMVLTDADLGRADGLDLLPPPLPAISLDLVPAFDLDSHTCPYIPGA